MDFEIKSGNPWIRKMPSELWKEVFTQVKNAYTQENCANLNKVVAQLRKVCPKWRSVIDNHIEFDVKLTAKFLGRNFSIEHVRFNKCSISRLSITPIEPRRIPLSYPHLVEEVCFDEFVSKGNFLVFAEYFGTKGKVKRVQISQGFGFCEKDKTSQKVQDDILGKFLRNVEKLDVVVPFRDLMVEELGENRNMLQILKNANLPNLKDFKIFANSSVMTTHLLLSFLLRHRSKLENVELVMPPLKDCCAPLIFLNEHQIDRKLYENTVTGIQFEDLENIRLKRIIIEGGPLCHSVWKTWMPIIMAQKKLLQLKLDNVCESFEVEGIGGDLVSFDKFIPLLGCNINTLTTLELGMFHFGENVDFKIFEQLSQLHTLTLQKQNYWKLSRIVNMTRLPTSLRRLALSGFACLNIQLVHLVKCDRLKEICSLELSSLYYYNQNQLRTMEQEDMLKFALREACSFSKWIY